VLWHASVAPVDALPRLAAAGDFTGDGVTDYAVWSLRDSEPASSCGVDPMQSSMLTFFDGASGGASQPVGPLADICWPAFGYPTHQLDFGTVYIGDFEPAYRGNEVIVIPYYATTGTVWNDAQQHAWAQVRGRGGRLSFTYPSVPQYDGDYLAANKRACSTLVAGRPCFVQYSHVPNAVFVRPGGGAANLFPLTSSRAVLYRPDLTPTGDVTWMPGGVAENAGRNYGLVESYRYRDRSYVDLVAGCPVEYARRAIVSGRPDGGDPYCGITRHFERFSIASDAIVRTGGVYYGYYGNEGAFEGRVEYPAHPRAPLGGPGTSWTAFDVFTGGRWEVQVFAGPTALRPKLVLPNWFIWDTAILDRSGQAMLLASRVTRGSAIPQRGFDILRWSRRGFHSIYHASDTLPALVRLANTPTRHVLDSNIFSSLSADLDQDGTQELLVENAQQQRAWLDWRRAG